MNDELYWWEEGEVYKELDLYSDIMVINTECKLCSYYEQGPAKCLNHIFNNECLITKKREEKVL